MKMEQFGHGDNRYGQLGNGATNNSTTPVQVCDLTNVKKIAAGAYHNIALKEDGSVWAWGLNCDGQLGFGTKISQTKGPYDQGYLILFQPPITVCSSNCDYTSIQIAINSASMTDTVVVKMESIRRILILKEKILLSNQQMALKKQLFNPILQTA